MSSLSPDIMQAVRTFVSENFLFREDRDTVGDSESLLDANIIDSTGVLELVAFLEEDFGISVADSEIVPENMDSIESISRYVERKRAQEAA